MFITFTFVLYRKYHLFYLFVCRELKANYFIGFYPNKILKALKELIDKTNRRSVVNC